MVMGGGGGRLVAYAGMHAAAVEAGLAPDLVIGTCGGALAAALVHAEPDPGRQQAWLASPEMYRFWQGFRAAPQATLSGALTSALWRWFDPRPAPRLPRVHDGALFQAPAAWPRLHWRTAGDTPEAVIVAARLLYAAHETGQPRRGRPLFEQVLFCRPGVAARLAMPAGDAQPAAPGSAVAPQSALCDEAALGDAVRLSFTDMFYLPAAAWRGQHYLGGVVNLLPVELASGWARQVWVERKAPATWTLGPAWRQVLGVNATRRLRQVDATPVALRLDTRQLARALPRQLVDKHIDWRANRLRLRPALSAGDHAQRVQAQWREGQRLMRAALERAQARGLA